MSGNAAAGWQTAIKGLQVCCSSTVGLLPDSTEAEAAYDIARLCWRSLQDPRIPPPKAVWKKVVLHQKVPMQLGTVFTAAAAQHSWKSPAMRAAGELLFLMLNMAPNGSSLAASILQQLRQSGMLQSLAAVMTAMAADLRSEAATIAAGDWHAAGLDVEQLVKATPHPFVARALLVHCRLMLAVRGTLPLPTGAEAFSWALDSSGHALAAMQLVTAAAQHASSVVQHVLPALRQQSPQQADEQLCRLATGMQKIQPPAVGLASTLSAAWSYQQQQQQWQGQEGVADSGLQQLLLSPHMLPYLTLLLVGHTGGIRRVLAERRHGEKDSNSRRGGSTSRSTGRSRRQPQRAADTNSSSSPAADTASGAALTGCELQLLQCLGFAPEVLTWMESPINRADADVALGLALNICTGYYEAVKSLVYIHPSTGCGTRQIGEQQQRWAAEQKHWLLLQTVLVPCAHDLLSPGAQSWMQQQQVAAAAAGKVQEAGKMQQQEVGAAQWAERLLRVSRAALHLSALLCEGLCMPPTPPAGWAEELLDGVAQVASRLGEQPLAAAQAVAALHGATASSSSNSSSSRSRSGGSDPYAKAVCASHVLSLLTAVAREKPKQYEWSVRSSAPGDIPAGTSGLVTLAVSPAAARFVQLGGAFEAALRAVTMALQSGAARADQVHVDVSGLCAVLFLEHDDSGNSLLLQHMGLCGPAALAQEQRELYSVLSTVVKLGRCRSAGGQLCWGERAAGSCCLATAQTAVSLLSLTAAAADPAQPSPAEVAAAVRALNSGAGAGILQPATAPAAAAAQEPAVDYLPSLVLFGRCCLQWAEQLPQQAAGLVLLASGPLQQVRQLQGALHVDEHSAVSACMCIPGMQQGAATLAGQRLESLVSALSEWVGQLESATCVEQLAAAGCSPQHLQQQLDALLAAQQGTQQGLTDVSLAALVQQLQVTGRMLCGIAVPHFCNNLGCENISGPTEARLVSGRSCLCAGCLTARYCGRDCQRAAWKQHKPVCKALAAAATAAEAANVG